jgi:hypothetical protein
MNESMENIMGCREFEVQLQILMQRIKEILANCYEGYESKAARPTSHVCFETRRNSRIAESSGQATGYFAGTARNQISNPKRISALRSENIVCNG